VEPLGVGFTVNRKPHLSRDDPRAKKKLKAKI